MKIPQRHLQCRTSNIRQDYATINKSIVDKLNPPNLYRFFCLSLYRNDYYKVRWRRRSPYHPGMVRAAPAFLIQLPETFKVQALNQSVNHPNWILQSMIQFGWLTLWLTLWFRLSTRASTIRTGSCSAISSSILGGKSTVWLGCC